MVGTTQTVVLESEIMGCETKTVVLTTNTMAIETKTLEAATNTILKASNIMVVETKTMVKIDRCRKPSFVNNLTRVSDHGLEAFTMVVEMEAMGWETKTVVL